MIMSALAADVVSAIIRTTGATTRLSFIAGRVISIGSIRSWERWLVSKSMGKLGKKINQIPSFHRDFEGYTNKRRGLAAVWQAIGKNLSLNGASKKTGCWSKYFKKYALDGEGNAASLIFVASSSGDRVVKSNALKQSRNHADRLAW